MHDDVVALRDDELMFVTQSPIITPINGLRIANQKAAMAIKGSCVFTSYLFFLSCDEKLFFRKVLFLDQRAAQLRQSSVL